MTDSADGPACAEEASWAHWWHGDVAACLAARERAYHGYRAAGDHRGAARMAQWIGDDHLWFRGAPAVAEGWFARARRLLTGIPEGPEHGWQAAFDAHVALGGGDVATARRLAEEAQRVGRAQGAVALEMFGVATEGVVRLEQGDFTGGLRCLDEAAAAALAGEYEHQAPAAWACCLLLSACEELRDDERGAQWCRQISEFGHRIAAPFVAGNCRSHHGSILMRQCRWRDAEHELRAAVRTLTDGPAGWRQDALARLGGLHRRQGETTEARRAYDGAGEQWLAQAGRAALHLDEGDTEGAVELVERALRQLPPDSPKRVEALEVGARARLARGEGHIAAEYTAELRRIAEAVATAPLLATARLCEARVASADRVGEAALGAFADAVAAFERSGAPLEAARARLELADALERSSRPGAAFEEARRARAALAELGAEHGGAQQAPCPLTPRQVEVLRLAAEGLTERGIAERLVVSEHTVHRHLANIYARLGCPSRAAAVAHAGRVGLL